MSAELINHLWQSTLFCGLIWLVTLTLRGNSAALRHTLWLLASAKFLIPFSWLFQVGAAIGLPVVRATGGLSLIPEAALHSASGLVAPTWNLQALDSGPHPVLAMALLALWFAGAMCLALRWALAWRAADFLVRAARPAPGAPADARVTDAVVEPAVARIFHPVVLLPAALLGSLPTSQMNAVLAHERQHINRRDNLTGSVHRLVETLFWFHPLVWWIGHQLLEERERACDEAVLEQGHDRVDYASGILAVCRHCSSVARTAVPLPASAIAGNLTARIRHILVSGQPPSPGFFKTSVLMSIAIAVAVAPLAAGAVDGAWRRHSLIEANARMLHSAEISIGHAADGAHLRPELTVGEHHISIRNSTLRDLIALAYDIEGRHIVGGESWLDSPRYEVRLVARDAINDPERFDPLALRGVVTQLLASRYGLEIHVNRRCQSPCGRHAMVTSTDIR